MTNASPAESPAPTAYRVVALRRGQVVEFDRPDVASAFATARRLRSLGWLVNVADAYEEPASSVRRVRAAQVAR